MRELFPYQQEGVRWACKQLRHGFKAIMIADEPGLGKTLQAIRAAASICSDYDRPTNVGIVCPAAVTTQWNRAVDEDFVFQTTTNFTVASYERAQKIAWPKQIDVLIVDEAHYLKSRSAKRTQFLLGPDCKGGGLVSCATKVILLTGTPTPNNPAELWPVTRSLFPAAITSTPSPGESARALNYWQFVKRYCVTEQNYLGHEKIIGGKNLAHLREAVSPYILRRTSADVATERPKLLVDPLYLDKPKTLKIETSDAEMIRRALEKEGVSGLKKISSSVATLRRHTGLAKVAPVVSWVREWFESGGGKIALYAYHREVIEQLTLAFNGEFFCVDGAVASDKRPMFAEAFAKHPSRHVFIGQNKAAGVGLDGLQYGCSMGLLIEPEWVPDDNEQIFARLARTGQTKPVTWRVATFSDSIDEDINRACIPKAAANAELWS